MKIHFHVRFVNWMWHYAMYNLDYAEGKEAADLICENVSASILTVANFN